MNAHDSERVAGLLEDAGYTRASEGDTADLIVFNTCAVRENAADRLYGNLGQLLPTKKAHKGVQIAAGGSLGQMERQTLSDRAARVEVLYVSCNRVACPGVLDRSGQTAGANDQF